jgi:hypothetical protein
MPTAAQLKRQLDYKEKLEGMNKRDLIKQIFVKEPISRESVQKEIEKRAKADHLPPDQWIFPLEETERRGLHRNQAEIYSAFGVPRK